jgi:peptidyl-tRNA hydrolase, PTH1 family
MKLIVGLGNPGQEYAATRHNVGFMAIDRLCGKYGISVHKKQSKGLAGEGVIRGHKVAFLKPQTYMNLSGESVRAFMDFYKVKLEDVIIVYDDLDTEIGKVRLRYQGSAGGHNGIKSLIQHLGTEKFNRIRIGISRPAPGKDIAHYVLAPFAKAEAELLDRALDVTCDALETALDISFESTMGKFNG